jgi:hypothetical protein
MMARAPRRQRAEVGLVCDLVFSDTEHARSQVGIITT